jgi:hypothetical protein
MKHKVIKSSELGTNCWRAVRFTGGECQRVESCQYPEKATCLAYQTKTRLSYRKERTHASSGKTEVVESGEGMGRPK